MRLPVITGDEARRLSTLGRTRLKYYVTGARLPPKEAGSRKVDRISIPVLQNQLQRVCGRLCDATTSTHRYRFAPCVERQIEHSLVNFWAKAPHREADSGFSCWNNG
jgi:hypothetical protein